MVDGKIDFDDRPEKTEHKVTQLRIGVPFISSLPTHVDIKVEPEFFRSSTAPRFNSPAILVPFKDSRARN